MTVVYDSAGHAFRAGIGVRYMLGDGPLFPEQVEVEAFEATGAWRALPWGEWRIRGNGYGAAVTVPVLRAVLPSQPAQEGDQP